MRSCLRGLVQLISRSNDWEKCSCQEVNGKRSAKSFLIALACLEWHRVVGSILDMKSTTLDTSRTKCSRCASTKNRASEDRHDGGSGKRWRSESKCCDKPTENGRRPYKFLNVIGRPITAFRRSTLIGRKACPPM